MPEHSRIFARFRPSLAEAFAAHPVLGEEVFHFPRTRETPYAPPPRGLLVVKVPGELWSRPAAMRLLGPGVLMLRAEEDASIEERRRAAADPALWGAEDTARTPLEVLQSEPGAAAMFPWLAQVAPPVSVLRWLRGMSRAHRVPVAWYHLLERGDSLYYDLAVVFDEQRQFMLVRTTFLVDEGRSTKVIERRGRAAVVHEPFGFVLPEVWKALGARDGPAYFPPDDSAGFDWESRRVARVCP